MNAIHSPIAGEDRSPRSRPDRAMASQPSRSNRSLTARHHRLPGGLPSMARRTPRSACQRMKDAAALRNRSCRRELPSGPRYVRVRSAMRPDGSSRTSATCAAAQSLAVSSDVIRDTCELRAQDRMLRRVTVHATPHPEVPSARPSIERSRTPQSRGLKSEVVVPGRGVGAGGGLLRRQSAGTRADRHWL